MVGGGAQLLRRRRHGSRWSEQRYHTRSSPYVELDLRNVKLHVNHQYDGHRQEEKEPRRRCVQQQLNGSGAVDMGYVPGSRLTQLFCCSTADKSKKPKPDTKQRSINTLFTTGNRPRTSMVQVGDITTLAFAPSRCLVSPLPQAKAEEINKDDVLADMLQELNEACAVFRGTLSVLTCTLNKRETNTAHVTGRRSTRWTRG